jgi:hypothetical protein
MIPINLKLIAISATAGLLIGLLNGFAGGYKWQQGTIDDMRDDHAKQIAQIEAEAERDLKERQDQINHLQKEFAIADTNYQETVKNAQAEIARRDADIRALRSVPTVKVKRQVCAADRKDSDTKALDETSRAELDPETAVRIYGITDDGDAAIRQLTELQNRVNQLILVCPVEII